MAFSAHEDCWFLRMMKGSWQVPGSLCFRRPLKEAVSGIKKGRGFFAIGPGNAEPMAKMLRGSLIPETTSFSRPERRYETRSFLDPFRRQRNYLSL